MLATLLRIAFGGVVACLTVGFVRELGHVKAFEEVFSLSRLLDYAVATGLSAWAFALLYMLATEWLSIRNALVFVAAGILVALTVALLGTGTLQPQLAEVAGDVDLPLLLTMGGAGGLAYWAGSGRWAGWDGRDSEAASTASRTALTSAISGSRRLQCWPCLLAGLALAALPLVALGSWSVMQPNLASAITSDVQSQANASLAAAGYPWATLRVDDTSGTIVGTAPDETQRAAAFDAARNIMAPAIGVPGVVAMLRNDMTIPTPLSLTAPSVPAVSSPAVQPKPTARDEQQRSAAEAEAKRMAEQERKRLAAEAETRLKARQEQDRLAAKRKAEQEQKRLADAATPAAAVVQAPTSPPATGPAPSGTGTTSQACSDDAFPKRESMRLSFDLASTELKTSDTAKLERMIEVVRACPDLVLRVAGHADAIGDPDFNLSLAARRAQAVKAALEARGVAADRMTVESFGSARPLSADGSPESRAANRRVEFAFVRTPIAPSAPSPAETAQVATCRTDLARLLAGSGITFEMSSAEIKPENTKRLDSIATAAKACSAFGLLVEGHTDKTGSAEFNDQLSEQRAKAVRAALVVRGIPAARIEAKGLGARRPLDPADHRDAYARNRRIEIIVGDAAKPALN